jgi:hypothetical protein
LSRFSFPSTLAFAAEGGGFEYVSMIPGDVENEQDMPSPTHSPRLLPFERPATPISLAPELADPGFEPLTMEEKKAERVARGNAKKGKGKGKKRKDEDGDDEYENGATEPVKPRKKAKATKSKKETAGGELAKEIEELKENVDPSGPQEGRRRRNASVKYTDLTKDQVDAEFETWQ